MKALDRRHGFTLVELMVVLAVIGLLLALLFPAVLAARGSARAAQCRNNLREIGTAYVQRMLANPDRPPVGSSTWDIQLRPSLKNDAAFTCPIAAMQSGVTSGGLEKLTCVVRRGGLPVQSIAIKPGPNCQLQNITADSYEVWIEEGNNTDFRD